MHQVVTELAVISSHEPEASSCIYPTCLPVYNSTVLSIIHFCKSPHHAEHGLSCRVLKQQAWIDVDSNAELRFVCIVCR